MKNILFLILISSLLACERSQPETKTLEVKSPFINSPVAMDVNGYPALCDDNGYAMDLIKNTISHRVVNDEFVKCMDKAEFLDYLSNEGADIARFENIISQYPEFEK